MHILYPDPHPVPDDVPEALQILSTVDALGQLGVRVTLATPLPANAISVEAVLGHPLHDNVTLLHLPRPRGRSNKPFYRALVARRLEMGADAVLARNLKMAEALLKAGETKLFFETHEHFTQTFREDHPGPGLRQRFKLHALQRRERNVYRGARGLIALTSLLADDLRTAFGTLPPFAIAPDGVDPDLAHAVLASPPANDPPVILYLGSLHPWKGVNVLIEAMQWVDNARLCIVGGTPQRIAELTQAAAALNLGKRVEFCGPVPPDRRFAAIAAADICALPLIDTSIGARHTSPLKLFEYMAVGRAIVASDLPSLREVLRDGDNALLTPAGDARALASTISRLAADLALRQGLAGQARKDADGYTWQARARTVRDFIAANLRPAS